MSTRSGIMRRNEDDTLSGRYHHSDGYPEGLGRYLHTAYHEVFDKSVAKMIDVLINQHPAGWSFIIDCDWSQEPGFSNSRWTKPEGISFDEWIKQPKRPQCYCHGDRNEEEFLMHCLGENCEGSLCDTGGAEWLYVLRPEGLEVWAESGTRHVFLEFVPWNITEFPQLLKGDENA